MGITLVYMFCLSSYCFSEMAPVCAVVGGVLGQEIVKVVTLALIFLFILQSDELISLSLKQAYGNSTNSFHTYQFYLWRICTNRRI